MIFFFFPREGWGKWFAIKKMLLTILQYHQRTYNLTIFHLHVSILAEVVADQFFNIAALATEGRNQYITDPCSIKTTEKEKKASPF